jgi:hypothetical protein
VVVSGEQQVEPAAQLGMLAALTVEKRPASRGVRQGEGGDE